MTLREQQSKFALMVAKLILWAFDNGYEIALGDAYAKVGHISGSFHYQRLAIDLNLFKDGHYLTGTTEYKPLGIYWKSLGGSWGGDWYDGGHFSLGEGKQTQEV